MNIKFIGDETLDKYHRLRFGPTNNPTNWVAIMGYIPFCLDVKEHFKDQDVSMVEVGSHAGESSSIMAAFEIFNSITLVDMWDTPLAYNLCKANINKRLKFMYPDLKVEMIKGDSSEIGKSWDKEIDMVYIDADHSYEGVRKDLDAWIPHVKSGGIVSGHDYAKCKMFEGLIKAVDETVNDLGVELKTYPEGSWLFIKP